METAVYGECNDRKMIMCKFKNKDSGPELESKIAVFE